MHDVERALRATGLPVKPFQTTFIEKVFNDGVDIGALTMARSGGKTELLGRVAGLGVVEGSPLFRPHHEVVVFAGSMRQARFLFKAALRALPNHDAYRVRDNNMEVSILGPSGTKLSVYPSSGKRALGLGAGEHLLLADEPSSWAVRDGDLLWSALTSSIGKIDRMKLLVCGTLSPAEPDGWWPGLIRGGSSGRVYVQLHQATEEDPWDDLRVAQRANPLLRSNASLRATVRAERDAARGDSAKQHTYESFRLNRHRSAEQTMLITVSEWRRTLRRPVPARSGRCVLGIDIGASRSWSACWASHANGRQECVAVVPGVPDLAEQERRDGLASGTLRRLVDRGVMVVDEGRQVARVETLISSVPREWRVSHVVADRFHAATLADSCRWPIETRVNQWSTASEDIGVFRQAVLDGDFVVEERCRDLAALSFAHARVERDTSGNAKMYKAHRRQRDDVAQAAVLGVAGAARMPAPRRTRLHLVNAS